MKTIEKEYLERKLSEWKEMTENNHHTEARLDIALTFGVCNEKGISYAKAWLGFLDMKTKSQRTSLPISIIITDCMIDDIADVYGKNIARKVLGCL